MLTYLTKEQLAQIGQYLESLGIKDTAFLWNAPLTGNELFTLVQNNTNVKTHMYEIAEWMRQYFQISGETKVVQSREDLFNPNSYYDKESSTYMIRKGMLVSVIDERATYLYLGETLDTNQIQDETYWVINSDNGGLPIMTTAKKEHAIQYGHLPSEYIDIGNPMLKGSPTSQTITIQQESGDYLQILFSAVRTLQSEVAKLKNTFNYGIESMTGTNTAFSYIENDKEEEKEPLWAISPEQLSEVDKSGLTIGQSSGLIPTNNVVYKENHLETPGECMTPSIAMQYEMEDIVDPKVLIYTTVTLTESSTFKVHLTNGTDIDLTPFLTKEKQNVMLVMSRVLTVIDEDDYGNTTATHTYGKNFYWLCATNTQKQVITQGYFNESFTALSSKEPSGIADIGYIDYTIFKDVDIWRYNVYSKPQGFVENQDILDTPIPNDNFTYKAAHITIRSVSTPEILTSISDKILNNELIWVESSSALYIKTNGTIKALNTSSGGDINTGMTQQEMINWLLENNLVKQATDGSYELNTGDSTSTFGSITLIHEKSGKSFEVTVDDSGNLRCIEAADTAEDIGGNADEKLHRGAVALYELGSSKVESTTESDFSSLMGTTQILKGDRVRISSWYIPNEGQTAYNCTHDFIEITNSSTMDYPLSTAILGVIYHANSKDDSVTGYSVKEFPLSGTVKAGSSYLIRGKKHLDYNSSLATVPIKSYDFELYEGNSEYALQGCIGLLLYHKNSAGKITAEHQWRETSTLSDFTYKIDSTLIDAVLLNSGKTILKSTAAGTTLIADASYTVVDNAICKDQYALDPAKQAFRSLTGFAKESSNCRLAKVAAENIVLNEDTIEFPHSSGTKEVSAYAPKASYENKNILTDKTKPDFRKPNMVTVSFGIDAQTTRCFNWFSMGHTDEFVWIRKQGEASWTRFESYKKGDGTDTAITYTGKSLVRKEFNSTIIDSVYARVDNVFPGDSTYQYRTHKCIIYISDTIAAGNDPITYEYVVGRSTKGGKPKDGYVSDIQTFTMYPSDYRPVVFQTTDQQGFGWMEYQVWAAAAEEINNKINSLCSNANKTFPILVNTGDMTQNGTRVNEWIDYYEAGKCLFNHLEQMNVVGNNDLCNAYNETILGTGNDDGKSSPYYFHQFYCYEIDNITSTVDKWTHPLIYNGVFVPSMYYFYFGKYAYIMCNSELTTVGCFAYWGKNVSSGDTVNLYTGYIYGGGAITAVKTGYLADTIATWLSKLSGKTLIVMCHEMPFTVTTSANLQATKASADRSLEGTSLVGSHMNRLGKGDAIDVWGTDDVTYWFSTLLQKNGVKLCVGGHKHTYAVTYPITEVSSTEGTATVHFSKKAKIKRSKPTYSDGTSNDLWSYDESLSNGVVYFMCQATGYKLTSNKELPSRSQAYSKIVPETSGSKADVSQTYPMYATFEYTDSSIKANLYRVANIKKESTDASTHKATITEFSETAYSTKNMYSERLLAIEDSTNHSYYKNYWEVPTDKLKDCVGYSGTALVDIQRCYVSGSDTYTYVDSSLNTQTFTQQNACTIEISL